MGNYGEKRPFFNQPMMRALLVPDVSRIFMKLVLGVTAIALAIADAGNARMNRSEIWHPVSGPTYHDDLPEIVELSTAELDMVAGAKPSRLHLI